MILEAKSKKIHATLLEIMKKSNFRQDLINVLTIQICIKAKMSSYVVLFGQDFHQSIKYQKGTLMQLTLAKLFNITIFEAPMFAVNTV